MPPSGCMLIIPLEYHAEYIPPTVLSHASLVSVITLGVSRGTSSRVSSLPSRNISNVMPRAPEGGRISRKNTGVTTTQNRYALTIYTCIYIYIYMCLTKIIKMKVVCLTLIIRLLRLNQTTRPCFQEPALREHDM